MKTLLLVFGSFIGLVAGNLEFSRTIKNTADDFTFVLKVRLTCFTKFILFQLSVYICYM